MQEGGCTGEHGSSPCPAVTLGSESSAVGCSLPLCTVFSSCVNLLQKPMHFSLRVIYSFLPHGAPVTQPQPCTLEPGRVSGSPGPELVLPTVAAEAFPGKKGRVGAGSLLWGSLFRNRPALEGRISVVPVSALHSSQSPRRPGVSLRRRDSGGTYTFLNSLHLFGALGENSLELRRAGCGAPRTRVHLS